MTRPSVLAYPPPPIGSPQHRQTAPGPAQLFYQNLFYLSQLGGTGVAVRLLHCANRIGAGDQSARRLYLCVTFALLTATVGSGCASTQWVSVRSAPHNPLTDTLGLLTKQGPKPSERTEQLLRRYDLLEDLGGDRGELLSKINAIDAREPERENLYAIAELAYVGAKRADQAHRLDEALELYGAAVLHAYHYLFDQRYPSITNPYDPQFRRACDLYNGALEGTLRIVQAQGGLRPGITHMITTANHDCQLKIELHSNGWDEEDFDHFKFVSDYEVNRLRNHYHGYGLGVPLIAVRKKHLNEDPREQFYPDDLSFSVTAFLRVQELEGIEVEQPADASSEIAIAKGSSDTREIVAVLEIHDPLEKTTIEIADIEVPLETDLSTPLAHTLSQPALDDADLSTVGLLRPEKADGLTGLYMLEPFQPEKIPVVMVHGLWSSPVTWMEMFNDLRSDPTIRESYQFWFYLYPSGQPFWFSAAQMREDLAHLRQSLDPQQQMAALDQTVLVGHSMGGLVSKLQAVESGDEFWAAFSDRPFNELQADPEILDEFTQTYFFDSNPSIRRVVTIGTPHRGSEVANDLTRWLGRKLIRIPNMIMRGQNQLIARNPDFFRENTPLNVSNSIDSLDPDSPLLPVLLTAEGGPWVKYHNIVGEVPQKGIASWIVNEGDGVVSLDSAKLENIDSQLVVPADHISVHRHPSSILEVRRILLEQIEELRSLPIAKGTQQAELPAVSAEAITR